MLNRTLPAETSSLAVVVSLCALATLGVQPRMSCLARREATTTSSNGFDPTALLMSSSMTTFTALEESGRVRAYVR